MRRTWLRGLAATAAVTGLLALSACGDDQGPAADPGDDRVSQGATVAVTFHVSGGITLNGTVTQPAPSAGLAPGHPIRAKLEQLNA